MSSWKEVLWQQCKKAYYKGGEIKIIFIRRQNKVIPIIQSYIDNQVKCDEETVVGEED
jgi:hypothetical protein